MFCVHWHTFQKWCLSFRSTANPSIALVKCTVLLRVLLPGVFRNLTGKTSRRPIPLWPRVQTPASDSLPQASDLGCCCPCRPPSRSHNRELCHRSRRVMRDQMQSVFRFDHLGFCIGLPSVSTKSDWDLSDFDAN